MSSNRFTRKRYSANERAVLDLLNKKPENDFKLSENRYDVYDIYGTLGGVKTLVEVKERRENDWPTWYIEKAKIDSLIHKRSLTNDHINLYLIKSTNSGHYIYDIDDIINYQTKVIKMNKRTVWNDGKIDKEVYEFPKSIFIQKL